MPVRRFKRFKVQGRQTASKANDPHEVIDTRAKKAIFYAPNYSEAVNAANLLENGWTYVGGRWIQP